MNKKKNGSHREEVLSIRSPSARPYKPRVDARLLVRARHQRGGELAVFVFVFVLVFVFVFVFVDQCGGELAASIVYLVQRPSAVPVIVQS